MNNTEEDNRLLETINRVKYDIGRYKATNYWECWVGVVLLLIGVAPYLAGGTVLGMCIMLAGAMCVQTADYKAKIGLLQYQLSHAYNNMVISNERIFNLEIVVDSLLNDTIVEVEDNETSEDPS